MDIFSIDKQHTNEYNLWANINFINEVANVSVEQGVKSDYLSISLLTPVGDLLEEYQVVAASFYTLKKSKNRYIRSFVNQHLLELFIMNDNEVEVKVVYEQNDSIEEGHITVKVYKNHHLLETVFSSLSQEDIKMVC